MAATWTLRPEQIARAECILADGLESIQTEADGISRTGVLVPEADVANIRYVYVITQFEQ